MAEGTEDPGTQQGDPSEALDGASDQERGNRTAIEDTRRLVELFLCEEGQLESFRDTWLPPDTPANAEQLRAARSLLHRLANVLKAPGIEAWMTLAGAATALDAGQEEELSVETSVQPAPIAPPAPAKPPVVGATMMDGSAPEAVSPWARSDAPGQGPPPNAPPPAAGAGPTAPGMVPTPEDDVSAPDGPDPTASPRSAPARVTPPPPPSSPTELSPGAVPPEPDSSADSKPLVADGDPLPAAETNREAAPEEEEEDELRETVAVETLSPLKEALAEDPRAMNLPDLTIQQYASLCAEREVKPAEREMIHQKYGLPDDAASEALDAHWHRLFDTQPQVRERWQDLHSQYVAWLRQQG